MMLSGRIWSAACILFVMVAVGGCGPLRRGQAVPSELQDRAVIPGMGPQVRSWGAEFNPAFMETLVQSIGREEAALKAAGHTGPLPPAEYLAISGGGANGAFGAGLLCGWSAAGNRPEFKVVTGISTGALIAPFVFAGPQYDEALKEVYTKTKTRDLLFERGVLAGVFSDALADTKPMWKTMAKYVDQKLLDAIAAEYRKGRFLVIGTTNLDARRSVLWNVGEIAASGHPGALKLVQTILIASASIPVAFPPVFFDVEVDGKHYQEMHVDGGAMTQVFLYPPSLKVREEGMAEGVIRERRAYIIRNSRMDPDWAEVERSTLSIAGRAVDALIYSQGIGDVYRTSMSTQRDGVDFNLAYIPASFKVKSKEAFDPVYMSALFQVGYDLAKAGYHWDKFPPGFESMPPLGSP